MTRDRMYGSDTDFCAWMRSCKELPSYGNNFGFVASDNDVTVHRYMTSIDSIGTREVQGIMQIEVKTRRGEPSESQLDTLSKLNLFCGDREVGGVAVRFFGVFVLVMSGTSAENSRRMWWGSIPKNKHICDSKLLSWDVVSLQQLIALLRFDCHPRNIKDKTPFRRRHLTRQFVETETTLLGFDIEKITTLRS